MLEQCAKAYDMNYRIKKDKGFFKYFEHNTFWAAILNSLGKHVPNTSLVLYLSTFKKRG